jgi:hypothetical protein
MEAMAEMRELGGQMSNDGMPAQCAVHCSMTDCHWATGRCWCVLQQVPYDWCICLLGQCCLKKDLSRQAAVQGGRCSKSEKHL